MLFRKKIERSCSYCLKGTKIDDELTLCIKKGVVPTDGRCSGFSYDPTKRIPPRMKPLDTSKYDEEDYSL
jgi:hypothetical protein